MHNVKEGWWDGFRVWEVKPWDWGFLFSGFGFTLGEGDALEERER